MKINFAHVRHPSTSGGYINFAVFEARSRSGTSGNSSVLSNLTRQARAQGLRIDQSALAYSENGRIRYFGDSNLVNFLSRSGLPHWTHTIDA